MRALLTRLTLMAALMGVGAALAAEHGGGEGKKADKKITPSPSYLMVDPIYTTIVEGSRPRGLLMVGVGLDVPDEALRAQAEHAMPVLRDAFVRNLMAFTATQVRTDAQPDVALVAERLQRVADRALKRKGARVLLAQVALRITK